MVEPSTSSMVLRISVCTGTALSPRPAMVWCDITMRSRAVRQASLASTCCSQSCCCEPRPKGRKLMSPKPHSSVLVVTRRCASMKRSVNLPRWFAPHVRQTRLASMETMKTSPKRCA